MWLFLLSPKKKILTNKALLGGRGRGGGGSDLSSKTTRIFDCHLPLAGYIYIDQEIYWGIKVGFSALEISISIFTSYISVKIFKRLKTSLSFFNHIPDQCQSIRSVLCSHSVNMIEGVNYICNIIALTKYSTFSCQ